MDVVVVKLRGEFQSILQVSFELILLLVVDLGYAHEEEGCVSYVGHAVHGVIPKFPKYQVFVSLVVRVDLEYYEARLLYGSVDVSLNVLVKQEVNLANKVWVLYVKTQYLVDD